MMTNETSLDLAPSPIPRQPHGRRLAEVLLIVLVRYPEPDLRDTIDGSRVAKALLDAAPAVLAFLPDTFEAGLDLFQGARDSLSGDG